MVLLVGAPAIGLREALLSVEGVGAVQIDDADDRSIRATCQVGARDGIEAAIARAVAARWELYRLERQQPTLENVFLQYVKADRVPGADS